MKKQNKKLMCEKCKKHEFKIKYSDSPLGFSHGFITFLCRECYIDKIINNMKNYLEELKEQIEFYKKENAKKS